MSCHKNVIFSGIKATEYCSTVLRQINALGAKAENEPLSLPDFDEIICVNTLVLCAEKLNKVG